MYRVWNLKHVAFAVLIALAVAVPAVSAASAQEISDEHFKIAKQTVAATKTTEQLDDILPGLAERMKQQLIVNRPDEADHISDVVDDVAISLAPRRGDLEDEVARAFARIFSIEELNAIKAFFDSEAGQKLLSETPLVNRTIEQAGRVWANGIQRDLQEQVAKKLNEQVPTQDLNGEQQPAAQ